MHAKHLSIFNLHGLGEPTRSTPPDEIPYWLPKILLR